MQRCDGTLSPSRTFSLPPLPPRLPSRGHSAFLSSTGSIALVGRPTDFKNTIRHINTRGTLPGVQSLMTRLMATAFPSDIAPQVVTLPPSPTSDSKKDDDAAAHHIACGTGALTAAVTRSGRLFCLGGNRFGQCGNGAAREAEVDFVAVVGLEEGGAVVGEGAEKGARERVTGIALGLEHGVAVTDRGWLYTWGRGDRGQLAQGDKAHYQRAVRVTGPDHVWLDAPTSPTALAASPTLPVFVCASSGPASSAAIDTAGRVWVWGKLMGTDAKAPSGAGGVVVMADQFVPRRVAFPGEEEGEGGEAIAPTPRRTAAAAPRARRLSAAAHHDTAPLTRADSLPPGQGVLVAASTPSSDDGAATSPRPAVLLSHGHAHMSIVTADGAIWMTGLRGRGVLFDDSVPGLTPPPPGAPETTGEAGNAGIGTVPRPPEAAAAGAAAAAGTAAAATQLGEGEIPVPETHMQHVPWRVPPGPLAGKRIALLRSSLHHTYAVTECGAVFRWGWKGIVLEDPVLSAVGGRGAAGVGGGGGGVRAARIRDLGFGYSHAVVVKEE
jgi:alpha-tubulin suppressor-like RCC1 family protein